MESFAEIMKATAKAIIDSRKDRLVSLRQIKDEAEECCESATAFVNQAAINFREMAAQTRGSLKENRTSRSEYLMQFRSDIRKRREAAHKALQDMLASTREAREEHVGDLMKTCGEVRSALKRDFRQAARVWKGVLSGKKF